MSDGYNNIPAPLGAADDTVALTDEQFIEEYLGSMTGVSVDSSYLLQRSPSLGLRTSSASWSLTKDAIVQPLGAHDNGGELPPPVLPMLPDSADSSQTSSCENSRPPSVRRVRSYSTNDGHTEESFSPKNAALKQQHIASFSNGGGVSPMMRIDAARRSSNSSMDFTTGATGGSHDSSNGASPLGGRGTSFSSPRTSSFVYAPISPTMASASPKLISSRVGGGGASSNPSTVSGSPSSGVTSIQSAHTRSVTATNLQVDPSSNSVSPHMRKIRLRGGNSSSPGSTTLQHLAIPSDMDGLAALGPGISDGFLHNVNASMSSPPHSASSISGGRSHGSSVASEGGVFEAGFTQLSASSSFSSSSQSSQPLSPRLDENNLSGGGGLGGSKKTFRIKLVRQSHDGAYGMKVVERPAQVDRVASVPEHVRSAGAGIASSYGVQSPMFERPAAVERVPSVPEGHVPSLNALKISSPRHGPIAITAYTAGSPTQPLVPRPPALTTFAATSSPAPIPSAPSSAPAVEFAPTSPKSASSPSMSALNSGSLLKGRGGQIKFVVSTNAATTVPQNGTDTI